VEITAPALIESTRLDPFGSVSTAVGARQIDDLNALDIASALRRTPGVTISRWNPVGSFGGTDGGGVFIRGIGASRPGGELKTYVDGTPFYIGVWNHPLLDLLPVNAMRSIIVHKSPQPQVAGNQFAAVALEGLRPSAEGLVLAGRATAGQLGTATAQAEALWRRGRLDLTLAGQVASSDGARPNADGRLANLYGRGALRLSDAWSVGAMLLHLDNRAGDPGAAGSPAPAVAPRYLTQGTLGSAFVEHNHGDWRGELRLYANRGKGNWLNQPAPDGDTLTSFRLTGLKWRETLSPWAGGQLVGGIDGDQIEGDVQFQRVAPAPMARFDGPRFRIVSPHLAMAQRLELGQGWSLTPSLGVRHYAHSEFPSETAPHAGLVAEREGLALYARVARGINYPGLETVVLSQLIPALGQSWRTLQAERMDHAELGVRWAPAVGCQLEVTLFENRLSSRYVFGFPPNVPPPPKFTNLGSYQVRGVELSWQQALGRHWAATAGLTWQDASISSLPYTPERSATLGVNGRIGPWRIALDAQAQSTTRVFAFSRTAGNANLQRVGGFAVASGRVGYALPALGRDGEVFVAVENLFERDYAYRPGYPMPGRWAQLGLAASF
jgi:iron complex outermembrane receptor protein